MIRTLRPPALLRRQPFAASLPTPTHTRLAAQGWRSSAARNTPNALLSRSVHSAGFTASTTTRATTAATTAAGPLLRGAWRQTSTRVAGALGRTQRRNFGWSWRRRQSSKGGNGAKGGKQAEESLSLSARLRKLSREYGWAAAGVYLGLSVLDFPFCFLLVQWAGTERIAAIEHYVISSLKSAIPESVQQRWHEWRAAVKGVENEQLGDNHVSEDIEKVGWGVEEAQERNNSDASLATQLALAYAIHKSFIFVRVPLTAAVTPKVVKVLRSWGWQIGKRKPRTKR